MLDHHNNLDEASWSWFVMGDIFDIQKGKRLTKSNMEPGTTPFIGAIDSQNGYREFIDAKPIHKGNTITVNYNGSVAEAFYQPIPFWASDDCNVLYNNNLNEFNGLFICTIIKKERYRFNYGRKWHLGRMKKSRIKLPTTPAGTPDWQFMEKYIKKIKSQFPNITPNSANAHKKDINNAVEWKEFFLNDKRLFTITGSKSITETGIKAFAKGRYPYITTSSQNNGAQGFYDYHTEKGKVLTIDSATIGSCFYQDREFSASDHIEKLIPNFKINKFIGLFLVTILNKEKYRYGYGRKFSQTRLRKTKIKLPVNTKGAPNWQFMEDYIKSLPYSSNL